MNKDSICIIEDKPIIAEYYKILLKQASFTHITIKTSFKQFIEDKQNHSLYIIDITIKNKDDGIKIGEYVHKKNKNIIFCSAHTNNYYLTKSQHLHAIAFFTKPLYESYFIKFLTMYNEKTYPKSVTYCSPQNHIRHLKWTETPSLNKDKPI